MSRGLISHIVSVFQMTKKFGINKLLLFANIFPKSDFIFLELHSTKHMFVLYSTAILVETVTSFSIFTLENLLTFPHYVLSMFANIYIFFFQFIDFHLFSYSRHVSSAIYATSLGLAFPIYYRP